MQLRGKAEAKEGDALLRFARSCKQTVSRTPSSPEKKKSKILECLNLAGAPRGLNFKKFRQT
ncbi:hypothetical protein CAMRE0001_0304 [Campylobacter rectus RM3267]|uniref:Uncharacterized protein n=1 Tax=Campylobacter rectus RM3267 TaxID=553218 RepID=B9CY96_CAMRE|nr:hypothetical protein CAMRE0001_0304 [Campylobacter rectus RM3267]